MQMNWLLANGACQYGCSPHPGCGVHKNGLYSHTCVFVCVCLCVWVDLVSNCLVRCWLWPLICKWTGLTGLPPSTRNLLSTPARAKTNGANDGARWHLVASWPGHSYVQLKTLDYANPKKGFLRAFSTPIRLIRQASITMDTRYHSYHMEVRNVGANFGVIYGTNYGLKWTNMPSFNHRMCPLTRRENYKAAEVPEWTLGMCDIN